MCLNSVKAKSQSHSSKQVFRLFQHENGYYQPVSNWPEVLTKVDQLKQSQQLGTCPRPKCFFLMACCCTTWELHFLAWASSQDVHFRTKQFGANANWGLITVVIKECFPFWSFAVYTQMSSCIWCTLILNFQYQSKSSFCALVRFTFSLIPTQWQHILK